MTMFMGALDRRELLSASAGSNESSLANIESLAKVVAELDADAFLQIVNEIWDMAFSYNAWEGKTAEGVAHHDTEFRTMCRMLQEIELFLCNRYAVKHADIGLMRRNVEPLAVSFFGAGQFKYGHEMLYYRWLLSPACAPELQKAILASGLVNMSARPDGHKATDLLQEHLNLEIATSLKNFKNSTHDIDAVFNRMCLTNTWIKTVRTKLEGEFGQSRKPNHTTASTAMDMFSLGRKLYLSKFAAPRKTNRPSVMFDSRDIKTIGVDGLMAGVVKFNANIQQLQLGLTAVHHGSADHENEEELVDAVDDDDSLYQQFEENSDLEASDME
jgi:hypothetical protein